MSPSFKSYLKVVPLRSSNTLPWHFVHADLEEIISLIETSMPLFPRFCISWSCQAGRAGLPKLIRPAADAGSACKITAAAFCRVSQVIIIVDLPTGFILCDFFFF